LMMPHHTISVDPFQGFANAGNVEMDLFEFSGEYFKDLLENLRKDKQGQGGHKWSVDAKVACDEYWRHLDAKIKKSIFNKRTGKTDYQWALRSEHSPDHLDDCEIEQIAYAAFLGFLNLPPDSLV
jgi:hypothetical protein